MEKRFHKTTCLCNRELQTTLATSLCHHSEVCRGMYVYLDNGIFAAAGHDQTSVVHDEEYEEDVDAYTNHDVVERAFAVMTARFLLQYF
jgi:hypothetical protein